MTRGPAKPTIAFGSAIITSPNDAKLAITPAVVGLVRTEINGSFAFACKARAPLVFAICIRLSIPSYMRAPPEAATMITPARCTVAYSIIRVIQAGAILIFAQPILVTRHAFEFQRVDRSEIGVEFDETVRVAESRHPFL